MPVFSFYALAQNINVKDKPGFLNLAALCRARSSLMKSNELTISAYYSWRILLMYQ